MKKDRWFLLFGTRFMPKFFISYFTVQKGMLARIAISIKYLQNLLYSEPRRKSHLPVQYSKILRRRVA
jgi:hypothetical protein